MEREVEIQALLENDLKEDYKHLPDFSTMVDDYVLRKRDQIQSYMEVYSSILLITMFASSGLYFASEFDQLPGVKYPLILFCIALIVFSFYLAKKYKYKATHIGLTTPNFDKYIQEMLIKDQINSEKEYNIWSFRVRTYIKYKKLFIES